MLVPRATIFLAREDLLKPALLMERASNMIAPTLFSIAIEQFAGLSSDNGNSLLKTAIKPSRFNLITSKPFFEGLSLMQR